MRIQTALIITLSATCLCASAAVKNKAKTTTEPTAAIPYVANRAPLVEKQFLSLPIGDIQPKGWMRQQLERQRDGMTGHLDSIYSRVMGPRNGWLGGDGDVWERGPYWIDGLLPLAYILNDQRLKDKVQPWIEWTLASQKEDGYFGPDTDRPYEDGLQRDNSHDWWPKMVMLKVMQQYYMATGDERVIPFMTKYFQYQLKQLPITPLGKWTYWASQRGGDNLQVVYWLYNITGDAFLLDLAELIHKQTFQWATSFLSRNELTRQRSYHTVNLAQGFKEPAVYWQQSKDNKQLEALRVARHDIRNTIGFPTGLWAGDENLRFGEPTLGSELCTAVEMMFSLESIVQSTSDARWADWLETVAFNALPTQTTPDFTGRQYFQQVNQVKATREWRNFSVPHEGADQVFGELNGYPCCTSNMHQGWPKLVQNLFFATPDSGVAAIVYAPMEATVRVVDGATAIVTEQTDYPFDGQVNFTINYKSGKGASAKSANSKVGKQAKARKGKTAEAHTFPFVLRIPEWCNNPALLVNGDTIAMPARNMGTVKVVRKWKQGDKLTLVLPMRVRVSRWYDNAAVVERGPLLYALKMHETWTKKYFEKDITTRFGNWYWEITSDSPWNYTLPFRITDNAKTPQYFDVKVKPVGGAYPWTVDNAPVTLTTKARTINNWVIDRGSVGSIIYDCWDALDYDTSGEEKTIELVPYGCTRLRVAEFPLRSF